ncbi:MAG: nitrite/sulfite reductase [Acidobacteria bacterium]|nr:nitrite/sulfite reductase [Acidobacteriota bacterium]
MRQELDVYETELRRVQQGLMPEKVFLEFRLRHGVYGQRQVGVQMQRIKIPLGMLTTRQMERLADLAEEYADAVCHITTRQDIQLHFVDINDTPNLMRRLAEVGITTREACGNVVRNVCACPQSGICSGEAFDTTPYAQAMAYFLLRHPDGQNFGRKFKIAFSGCEDQECGLALMHDIGAIAKIQNGERGFKVYVGGGLGPLPHQAKLYSEFVPAAEMLPMAQAIARVFARLGEKKNRGKARMKFLVAQLGIEEFIRLVKEEREKLPVDPRWTGYLAEAETFREQPLRPPSELETNGHSPEFARWVRINTRPQRQPGYSMVTVFLPLGDISSDQMRGLARLCRQYVRDTVRTTVPQNLLVRWAPTGELPAFYDGLRELDLAQIGGGSLADITACPGTDSFGGGSLADITACPGTDSCKLGIASSRGLAALLHQKFHNGLGDLADRQDLKVKISGCFNSCGQHHIADIGFFGSVQRKGSHVAPVFQVLLGGEAAGNASAYGLAVAKVPAQNAPVVIKKLTDLYTQGRTGSERFSEFMRRLGKARIKKELQELAVLPSYEENPEFYKDNRQPWEFHHEVGTGECAGAVVDQSEFMLEDGDRLTFEATLAFDEGRYDEAAEKAFAAQIKAADALLFQRGLLLSDNYNTVEKFRELFYDTGEFYATFAENFLRAAQEGSRGLGAERTRRRLEETTLFIEMAQTVYSRMAGAKV